MPWWHSFLQLFLTLFFKHTVQWKSCPWTGNQAIGYSLPKLSSCWGLMSSFSTEKRRAAAAIVLSESFPWRTCSQVLFSLNLPGSEYAAFSRAHYVGSTWHGDSTCTWAGIWQRYSHLKRGLHGTLGPSEAPKLRPWDTGSLRPALSSSGRPRTSSPQEERAPQIKDKGVSKLISALNTFVVNSKKRHFTTWFISS